MVRCDEKMLFETIVEEIHFEYFFSRPPQNAVLRDNRRRKEARNKMVQNQDKTAKTIKIRFKGCSAMFTVNCSNCK